MPTIAYIALGANLGPREQTLAAAIVRIAGLPTTVVRKASAFLATAPVGGPAGQGEYLNAAIEVVTELPAEALMDALLVIERDLGRDRSHEPRNGPRSIDLDLLLYGDLVLNTPHLTVPHPRMHDRRFVLQPLGEIAGDVVHPVLGVSIGELLGRLPPERVV